MPVAVSMNIGPESPISPRITKAAFFRARSPPIERNNVNITSPNDLSVRLDFQTRLNQIPPNDGRYSPESSEAPTLSTGHSSATTGHTPTSISSSGPIRRPTGGRSQTTPTSSPSRNLLAGIHGVMNAPNHAMDEEDMYGEGKSVNEIAVMGIAGGSDEMLMTLLAGQAAVDCDNLPIGGWEEVESWKKELNLLSNRLSSLVARHQREVKILTAARTLQKLNNANKRMSKQTMESLEQSEKRAEAAEKEVLVLRDREAALRRRLMEHWSGVMAWEVRRLERVSAETQARFNRQSRHIVINKDRENQLVQQVEELQAEVDKRAGRVEELEEMVVEMGRRERAMEEEVRDLDQVKMQYEQDRDGWEDEKMRMGKELDLAKGERRELERERANWALERRNLAGEKEALEKERQQLSQSGRMSDRDRAVMDKVRGGLGGMLGKKTGMVGEEEVVDALEEARKLLERRENEVVRLKEEMREVNMGLEEELKRVSQDRDVWKSKADKADSVRKEEVAQLDRKLRNHVEQLSDLNLRNESLSTSLAAAQTHVSSMSTSNESTKSLQNRVDALTAELETIAGQFNEVWSILPPASRRVDADLLDRRTGKSNVSIVSPTKNMNFAALQKLYTPTDEKFSGIEEMLNRVRGLVDDGRLLVERMMRLSQERELHKGNAVKAKKMVEDSRHSLETYQQQVAVLEDRLASTGASESRFLEQLNSLQSSIDTLTSSKRNLDHQLSIQTDTCERLSQANDALSTRALTLAEEAEREMSTVKKKMGEEIEDLRKRLAGAEEEADEQRSRGQGQRIQLLDELNSLQAEVGDLRKQLRAVQR